MRNIRFNPTHVLLTNLENVPFYLGHDHSAGGSIPQLSRGTQLQLIESKSTRLLKKGQLEARDHENQVYVLNVDEVASIGGLSPLPEFGICGTCKQKVKVDQKEGNLVPHGPQFGICPGSHHGPLEYILSDQQIGPDPRPKAAPEPTVCGRCPKFCPYCGRPIGEHKHG